MKNEVEKIEKFLLKNHYIKNRLKHYVVGKYMIHFGNSMVMISDGTRVKSMNKYDDFMKFYNFRRLQN